MNDLTRLRTLSALRDDEGRQPRPYRDSEGKLTVGYGHCLETGPPLSQTAMDQILEDDLADAERLCAHLPWYATLSESRQAVIAMMVFQVGLGGVREFRRMIAAIEAEEWSRAGDEIVDSELPQARAHRHAAQMRSGQWPG